MASLRITAPAALFILASLAGRAAAESTSPAIYIPNTDDGFNTYVAAAIQKKNLPARVVAAPDGACLTLKVSPVHVTRDSTGVKVMKLAFSGVGASGSHSSASAELVDEGGTVVWSYSLQADNDDRQELAENLVKRLKKEFFHK
jgi:hypothetical protein